MALIFTAMAQLSLGYGIQILIDQGFANQSQAGLRQAVVFMIVVGFAMASGAFIRFYLCLGLVSASVLISDKKFL